MSDAYATRLGIYFDAPFSCEKDRLFVHEGAYGFTLFVLAVSARFSGSTLFARAANDQMPLIAVPRSNLRLLSLPSYTDLRSLRQVIKSFTGTIAAFWRGLDAVDVVWVFGPHPFALLLAVLALARRRRIVLGVRQETMAYFRSRLPTPTWAPILLFVAAMEFAFRALGRNHAVTAVGPRIAARYGAPKQHVVDMTVSLVGGDGLSVGTENRSFGSEVRLLSVGRVDSEKNPLLAIDALAALNNLGQRRFSLTWVGSGPLLDEMRARASALGVEELLEMPQFVPYGPRLLAFYREADIFVHTALTEGSPQVLIEAAAHSLPIVATDVGGVRPLMRDGAAALLVPPRNLRALVAAVQRLCADDRLRHRIIGHGAQLARRATLDGESARVAQFLNDMAGCPTRC